MKTSEISLVMKSTREYKRDNKTTMNQ